MWFSGLNNLFAIIIASSRSLFIVILFTCRPVLTAKPGRVYVGDANNFR